MIGHWSVSFTQRHVGFFPLAAGTRMIALVQLGNNKLESAGVPVAQGLNEGLHAANVCLTVWHKVHVPDPAVHQEVPHSGPCLRLSAASVMPRRSRAKRCPPYTSSGLKPSLWAIVGMLHPN
jgi:hypothetical protein